MGLKRIMIHYHTPGSMEIIQWFYDTFGDSQKWDGIISEPVELKSGYQWANGKHVPEGWRESVPCIWCTEKAYMLYTLRWF